MYSPENLCHMYWKLLECNGLSNSIESRLINRYITDVIVPFVLDHGWTSVGPLLGQSVTQAKDVITPRIQTSALACAKSDVCI
jgi:hypothetical protein